MNLPRAFLHANLVEKMGKKENKKKTGDGEQGTGGAEHDGGCRGEMSAPIFCLLFAQISTDPQLFVSAPNSFLGEANALPAGGMNTSGSPRAHPCPGYSPTFGNSKRCTYGTATHGAAGSSGEGSRGDGATAVPCKRCCLRTCPTTQPGKGLARNGRGPATPGWAVNPSCR